MLGVLQISSTEILQTRSLYSATNFAPNENSSSHDSSSQLQCVVNGIGFLHRQHSVFRIGFLPMMLHNSMVNLREDAVQDSVCTNDKIQKLKPRAV